DAEEFVVVLPAERQVELDVVLLRQLTQMNRLRLPASAEAVIARDERMGLDHVDKEGVEPFGHSQRVGQCDIAVAGEDRTLEFLKVGLEVIDPNPRIPFFELMVDERQSSRCDR